MSLLDVEQVDILKSVIYLSCFTALYDEQDIKRFCKFACPDM